MNYFARIVEEKIRKAQKEGAFDDLPGLGKPLPPDELRNIPEDLRMAYRMMKNAGFSPDEIDIRKELLTIEDLIRKSEDEMEKEGLRKELNARLLEYNRLLSKKRINTNSSIFKRYQHKIDEKLFK